MIDKADDYSDNSYDPSKSVQNTPLNSPSPIKNKHFSAQAHLYPIDEAEDFHDPFSDLSLFLSKKIKNEIQKHGSSKQWSSKIESNLLAGILPEFKIKFPKYRIGVSAIKKVWEKVSYYYGKVQTSQEAVGQDGKLNIEFMIKENLRGYPYVASSQLPHYHAAHQIAIKMSECIAALDGTKPRLDHLTKTIWVVQKHLLNNLPAKESKNIYDDYDSIDKLIVKVMLESTTKNALSSQKELQEQIKKEIYKIKDITKKYSIDSCYHHLCVLLAQRLFPNLSIHQLLNTHEKKILDEFITKQISIARAHQISSVESSQRILALYPLACCLPKTLPLDDIRQMIRYLYDSSKKEKSAAYPNSNHTIYAFIQAELHFLKRKEFFPNYIKVEEFILNTLFLMKDLPHWKEEYAEELEIYTWYCYSKEPVTLPQSDLSFFKDQIAEVLFDAPSYNFKKTLYQIIDSLKKNKVLLNREKSEDETLLMEELNNKIYLWSIQNDMICRWIHFDQNNPLLKRIAQEWKQLTEKNKTINHHQFIECLFQECVKNNTYLNRDTKILHTRLSILYKYFWYHNLSDAQESSIDRFAKFHFQDISMTHKDKSPEDRLVLLENRLSKMLPLTPVSRKQLNKSLNN